MFKMWLRQAKAVVLALAVTMAIEPAVLAEPATPAGVGDPLGDPFSLLCRSGDVLIGFQYAYGAGISIFIPTCAAVKAGVLSGLDYSAGFAGIGGADKDFVRCPENGAIRGLHVWINADRTVHHIRTTCYPLSGGQGGYLKSTQFVGGDTVGYDGVTRCPLGTFAVGMTGNFAPGAMNRVGLECGKVAGTDAPTPAPAASPTPNPAHTTRTASDATTVYDQPAGNDIAYLNAGDAVSIIKCQDGGQGWCQISAPKQGYVWGGDLDP